MMRPVTQLKNGLEFLAPINNAYHDLLRVADQLTLKEIQHALEI
jgi:hypothetical protein